MSGISRQVHGRLPVPGSVSSDAQAKTYPLDVYVNYKNSEGDIVDSKTETIGVPVGSKVHTMQPQSRPRFLPERNR